MRTMIAVALVLLAGAARADDAHESDDAGFLSAICRPLAMAQKAADARSGQWVAMTRDQLEFARGLYLAAPDTPAALPPGDASAIVIYPDKSFEQVFFLDDAMACGPLFVGGPFVKAMNDIGAREVRHVGIPQ